jgi:hypothetical protein
MATDTRFYKEPDVKKLNAELKEMVANPPKHIKDKFPLMFKQKASK